jgi:RNA polymerase sigma-70 factor (ECF subfamily)
MSDTALAWPGRAPAPALRVRRARHLMVATSTPMRGTVEAMPRTAEADDLTAVMGLVAAGDATAFARFYDATSRTVFGIVLRVLRDRAQAEEVAQEVYLEAWRLAHRFDAAQGSPSAWLNTIAHRRAVDRVRAVERTSARESREATMAAAIDVPDVSDIVVASAEGDRVRAALAELPEAQRTALTMAYFDGCTQREVSEILGVPLGTVKTRMRDAMRKLRVRLGEGDR